MSKCEILIRDGFSAIVDAEDFERLRQYRWNLLKRKGSKPPMAQRGCGILMHREILGLKKGDGKIADHINGNPLDNRKSNLRVATPAQNSQNRKARSNNKSGLKGVASGKYGWAAFITINGKNTYLGSFPNPGAAHARYCEAAKAHFGEYFCERNRQPKE